jgi:5-methylcytosine-specific restriction protein A
MRNPTWTRDELILALDLYFSLDPGQMHARHPGVIELSDLLNKLPIHEIRPDAEKFRNPNGVGLKLNNFKALDPNYPGKGMARGSKLDKEIFKEFINKREELSELAGKIKRAVSDESLNLKLYHIPDEEEADLPMVREGKVIYRLHKLRERDPKINQRKKEVELKKNGKLVCEVCGFDFQATYGELGKGFIECHHRKPLADLDAEAITRLEDLALVCANCHRMLHRGMEEVSVEGLKEIMR